jgi:Cu+-exporting ATPase
MPAITQVSCFHWGDDCNDINIFKDQKNFCCKGCVRVYSILSGSKLGNYYLLNSHPVKNKQESKQQFFYLDNPDIVTKLISFKDYQKTNVSFYISAIHRTSCIWLLEHLNTLNNGVLENRVDFLKNKYTFNSKLPQLV